MRKLIVVVALIFAMTYPAYAGDMTNDNTGRATSSARGDMPNGAPVEIPNGVAGDMQNGVAATSNIQEAQIALSLLQSLLSLF